MSCTDFRVWHKTDIAVASLDRVFTQPGLNSDISFRDRSPICRSLEV
jgi:hypothetical protein